VKQSVPKYLEKVRENLTALNRVIAGKQNPLILIYSNPDPDALASAWALKELMGAAGVRASIEYTGEVGRLENGSMIDLLRIPVAPLGAASLQEADLIALVDSQPGFFTSLELPRCDIVIDHHPRKSRKGADFTDIQSRCLATASIVTTYLQAAEISVSKRLATALYYGITTDSRNQQRSPTAADIEAIHFLERKVDRSVLRRIEFSSYSLSNLDYFAIALIKLRYSRNVVFSNVGPVPTIDICAQIADFLIRVREASWAVVAGVVRSKLIIIFRCDGYKKNAGKTVSAAIGPLGSAGGHRTMGRAEIEESSLPDGLMVNQGEQVELFIIEALARYDRSFKPLLRSLRRWQM